MLELPTSITEGGRNGMLYSYACSLQAQGMTDSEIAARVMVANEERCRPPLTDGEINTLVRSALAQPKGDPTPRNPKTGEASYSKPFYGVETAKGERVPTKPPSAAATPRKPLTEPPTDGAEQLRLFIGAAFEPGEHVSITMDSYQDEETGKFHPLGGLQALTAGELCAELETARRIEDVIGDYDHHAGAWFTVCPVDGKGRGRKNITAYRHCLVEGDAQPVDVQERILRACGLPITSLTTSGSKSVHALVRLDAADIDEWNYRRERVWAYLKDNYGFVVDEACKDPSRLSRLPGAVRGEQTQQLLALNLGAADYDTWEEEAFDDLPPIVDAWERYQQGPVVLDPEAIAGLVRTKRKLMITGPSKGAKSFFMIELAVHMVAGVPFLGMPVAHGPVLYLNLELDREEFWQRVFDVCAALELDPEQALHGLKVWNLRGKARPLEQLAPRLIRQCARMFPDGEGPVAIMLDPLYKINSGDENSNADMARFVGNFDRIIEETGALLVYSHHHTKGASAGKKVLDRGSGAGVLARDYDAQIDLLELDDATAEQRKSCRDDKALAIIRRHAAANGITMDDDATASAASVAVGDLLDPNKRADMNLELLFTLDGAEDVPCFRISFGVRGFAPKRSVCCWFDHPLHVLDRRGVLANLTGDGLQLTRDGSGETRAANRERKQAELFAAYKELAANGEVTVKTLAERLEKSERWTRDMVDEHPWLARNRGIVTEQ